jgi:hypothetical protein
MVISFIRASKIIVWSAVHWYSYLVLGATFLIIVVAPLMIGIWLITGFRFGLWSRKKQKNSNDTFNKNIRDIKKELGIK